MSTTNILDLNNRIDALEKISHNVEPIQQQIDELKAWTDSGTKDASGNPIILTDGEAFNAVDLKVSLSPKQSGSGTPSPTNVRPITGYTECVVDRDSRNLVDISAILDGKTLSTEDGSVQTGTEVSYVTDYIPVSKNQTIYIPATGTTRRWFYDTSKTAKVYLNNSGAQAYTPTEDGFIRVSANKTTVGINALQIEYGNTATPYVPYSHDNATIAFGQTVYGGSVDFKTGKVTVTHASIASYNGETINEPWLSSIDEYVSGTTPTTGAQVVYPLTTPTELTLTPAELELLKGYNYITSNGTTIDLTYQPDNLKADILLTVSQLYGSKISIFDGILTGGDTGQVLTKTSDDNYDATWATLPATRTTTKKSEK